MNAPSLSERIGCWCASIPRWLQLLSSLCLVTLLLYHRKADSFYRPQLWAEEAVVFFQQAYHHGPSAIFYPHAGYYHLYPRLVATFAEMFLPAASIPLLFNLAALTASWLAVIFLFSPRVLLPYKPVLALTTVACPVMNEHFMNLTNAQWPLGLGLILLLVSESPRRRKDWLVDIGLLLLAGMSSLLVVFLLPLFIVKVVIARSGRNILMAASATFMAIIQASGMETARVPGEFILWNFDFIRVLARPFQLLIFGPGAPNPSEDMLTPAICAGLLAACYLILGTYCRIYRNHRAALILASGLLVWLAVLYSIRLYPAVLLGGGDRYFYIQAVSLVWAALVLWPHARIFPQLLIISTALSLLYYQHDYRSPRLPNLKWTKRSRCIDQHKPCTIPINPRGWKLHLGQNWRER